jgi:hypothetical protein
MFPNVAGDLQVKISIVSPHGISVLTYGGAFTAYAAEEMCEGALRSGPGTYLEVTVPRAATDASLAQLRGRFAGLARHRIDVDVHREAPAGPHTVPPRAA